MLVAVLSDRLRHRFLFALIPTCISVTGFAILLTAHHHPKLQYAALFFIAMGCFSAMPVLLCWFTMNLGGHHRRAVGTAWQVGFGNIGGVVSTHAFLARDAPSFRQGYTICIAFTCLSGAISMVYFYAVWMENRRRGAEKTVRDLNLTEFERMRLGDLSPEYRYQL
jgi:MFS family permease